MATRTDAAEASSRDGSLDGQIIFSATSFLAVVAVVILLGVVSGVKLGKVFRPSTQEKGSMSPVTYTEVRGEQHPRFQPLAHYMHG